MNNLSVFEVSDGMIKIFHSILHKFLALISINAIPISIHPALNVFHPVVSRQPQIRIRQKLLC
jgi:hypothetical protein